MYGTNTMHYLYSRGHNQTIHSMGITFRQGHQRIKRWQKKQRNLTQSGKSRMSGMVKSNSTARGVQRCSEREQVWICICKVTPGNGLSGVTLVKGVLLWSAITLHIWPSTRAERFLVNCVPRGLVPNLALSNIKANILDSISTDVPCVVGDSIKSYIGKNTRINIATINSIAGSVLWYFIMSICVTDMRRSAHRTCNRRFCMLLLSMMLYM